MTELEHAIKHIKTRADAWAVKEVTEALQSISERLDKALSQEPCRVKNELKVELNELEPCDDKRLFIKIYADYEPSVVAEKVYQICDEDEFPEVVSRLNAYLEPCDDAINGDVIKTMFPNTEIMITDERVFLRDGTIVMIYPLTWWNAPYQKGGKE